MSNKYAVKITEQAITELDDIYVYIVQAFFAEGTAKKVLAKITDGIKRLADMPYSAALLSESQYCGYGIRKLVIDQYSFFYAVNEDIKQIDIFHILHGSQDYNQKL